jgi:hypothetical protein
MEVLASDLIGIGLSAALGGIAVWILLTRLGSIRQQRENEEWLSQIRSTPVDPRDRRV